MRSTVMALALAATLAAVVPSAAHSDRGDFQFEAYPCAATCPYWLDNLNADIDGNGQPEVFFEPCESPGLSVSYDELTVRAPTGALWLIVRTAPQLDWDTFVCGNNMTWAPTALGECKDPITSQSPMPMGCEEEIGLPVKAGRSYVIRSFNWLDVHPLPGSYEFVGP